MITEIRSNIFLADKNVTDEELKANAISAIVVVSGNGIETKIDGTAYDMYFFGLHRPMEGINKPHMKDLACHTVKYNVQNGETVCVIGETGLVRGAFVVARAICELENKSIYDIFIELQEKLKGFDIGKAYL